ncbi:hypothetical protein QT381_05195 [Galbitalea sp. SE-J8]|uniref:ATP-binding protein n=1 Tax=Galbitalea sp. SE-J8 TaxID=3054952 RepID=UPI00259CD0E2|nr:ATP-binding protein [Galbitalea sp. SE-J8]MDM4762400.1 hypothetical protein [Galbitalea sp. SE-J8]
MITESAIDRVLRVLALSIGVGSVIFTLLGLGDILAQSPYLDRTYVIAIWAVFFGLPALLAVLAFAVPVRVIRILAAAHAISAVVFLVFWDPALADGGIPGHPEPFLLSVISVATCTAALVLGWLPSWLFIFGIAAISFIVRVFGYIGTAPDFSRAFQDALLIAMFSGVMTTFIQLTMAIGRGQDSAVVATRESAAAAKAAEALDRQRTRYHAFTHDDVLATLNSAVHNSPDALLAVRASAQHALAKMNEFRDDPIGRTFHGESEMASLLRGAAVDAGAELGEIEVDGEAPALAVPVEVSDAIAEALAEAIRNSIRHAGWPDGRPVHRRVGIEFAPRGLRVVVADDGIGFTARRVAPDRLGVRVSILQRVNSQPGGSASLASARGRGTTVTIGWSSAGDAS